MKNGFKSQVQSFSCHFLVEVCVASVRDGKCVSKMKWNLEESLLTRGRLIISCHSKVTGKLKLKSHLTVVGPCLFSHDSRETRSCTEHPLREVT